MAPGRQISSFECSVCGTTIESWNTAGATLPLGRRADRDESCARSSGQRLVFYPRFLASLDGQWNVTARPSAFIGDGERPVALPPRAKTQDSAHAKNTISKQTIPLRLHPRRARKAPA